MQKAINDLTADEARTELTYALKELELKEEELRILSEDFSPEAWEETLQRAEEAEQEVACQENALANLRSNLSAQVGEIHGLETALSKAQELLRRFRPFLKRILEATERYTDEANRDDPEATELLFNIYEDAVMLRASLPKE